MLRVLARVRLWERIVRALAGLVKLTRQTISVPTLSKHFDLLATPDLVLQIAHQAERCCNSSPSESARNNHDPQWSGWRKQPAEPGPQALAHAPSQCGQRVSIRGSAVHSNPCQSRAGNFDHSIILGGDGDFVDVDLHAYALHRFTSLRGDRQLTCSRYCTNVVPVNRNRLSACHSQSRRH